MEWNKYSFVIRAKNRKKILQALSKYKTPTQLAGELNLNLSHISRALKELEKAGLIECLTPNEKVGRIYTRTKLGEEITKGINGSED